MNGSDASDDAVVHVNSLDGVVRLAAPYRPGERGWIKVKNRGYWRYDAEIESLRRSIERRQRR